MALQYFSQMDFILFDVLEVSKGSKYDKSAEISCKKEVSNFFEIRCK